MTRTPEGFSARDILDAGARPHVVYRLDGVRKELERTPYTIKVLLETVLRNCGRGFVTEELGRPEKMAYRMLHAPC